MIRKRIEIDFGSTEDIVFVEGMDEAIIGFDQNIWSVVYSRNRVVDMLVKSGMLEDEATEHAEENIFSVLLEDKTPVWVEDYNW